MPQEHQIRRCLRPSLRKLRVELVDDEGKPLRFQDEKYHPLKYDIIARDGYRARPKVE